MSSFWEYAIVVFVMAFVLLLLAGMIAGVLKIVSFLGDTEPEGMSDPEKRDREKKKNVLWLGIGVLLGAAIFGG